MKKVLSSIISRWKAETPRIHKRIIRISACVFSVSSFVMATMVACNASPSDWFEKVYPYIIGITAAIAGYSKFQKENKDE